MHKRRASLLAMVVIAAAVTGCGAGGGAGPDAKADRIRTTTTNAAAAGEGSASPTTVPITAPTAVSTLPEGSSPRVVASTPSGPEPVRAADQSTSDEQWASSFGIPLEREGAVEDQPVWLDRKGARVFIPSCEVAASVTGPGGAYAGYGYICRG